MKGMIQSDFARGLRTSSIIIGGSIVAVSAALYFLSGDISAQVAKIVADKTMISQQTAAVGVLAGLKGDAAQAAPYAAAMGKLLPTQDQLIGFPQWVAGIGQAHSVSANVSFLGTSISATASAPGSDAFSLVANGSSANLVAFLQDLEINAPGFLVAIDSFDFLNNNGQYQLTAQGRVFSQ